MYPPIASPTSPQDVQMTDLNILSAAPEKAHSIDSEPVSSAKSSNTLRMNIDVKNELNKKRTSLNLQENGNDEMSNGNDSIISSSSSSSSASSSLGQQKQQPMKLATVKRCSRSLDNASYRIEQRNNSINNNFMHFDRKSSQNSSSTESDVADPKQRIDTIAVTINENGHNRKVRRMRRKNNAIDKSNCCNDSDDDADYNDRQNGNASDVSSQKRNSVTSKDSGSGGNDANDGNVDDNASDDYFLCEKFKNTLNTKLCDAVVNSAVVIDGDCVASRRLSLELLSPHEGPLGRRYAEIAPSKNNATNNKW